MDVSNLDKNTLSEDFTMFFPFLCISILLFFYSTSIQYNQIQ